MIKKLNNKGFSLVELIIVIAIIAILAAVLAPQFLRFVEDGRESNDISLAANIETAIQTQIANSNMIEGNVITWDTDAGTLTATVGVDAAGTANTNTADLTSAVASIAAFLDGSATALVGTIQEAESNVARTDADVVFTVEFDATTNTPTLDISTDFQADWDN